MPHQDNLIIEIYTARGVVIKLPVNGEDRFLRERAFLDDLTETKWGHRSAKRPVPDPGQDFYMLDDDDLDAYSAFRRQMDATFGKPVLRN